VAAWAGSRALQMGGRCVTMISCVLGISKAMAPSTRAPRPECHENQRRFDRSRRREAFRTGHAHQHAEATLERCRREEDPTDHHHGEGQDPCSRLHKTSSRTREADTKRGPGVVDREVASVQRPVRLRKTARAMGKRLALSASTSARANCSIISL
jgi:hypothetical protein